MIICTNCNHENPEGSVQCENCYAPLPKTSPCPNCGSFTQINAAFCGQCGYNLLSEEPLAFIDSDDDSENLLEPKDTIPHETINYSFKKPWENLREEPDTSEMAISDLGINELEIISSDDEELEISSVEEELFIAGPDLDLESEITDELVPIDNEIDELEDSELLPELSLDTNSEQYFSEPDLEPDLELNSETELTELNDIEGLENATDKPVPELSPLEELDIANPDLDLAPEIPDELAAIDNQELEIANPELDLAPEVPDELVAIDNQELDIASSELDLAPEIPEIVEASTRSTAPAASGRAVVSSTRSWDQPIHPVSESATQLQLERIILFHVQTTTDIELSQSLDLIRIGKPNNQAPPDIDVSGFPDANIVSRVHANIRMEGNTYFIEDAGSSNGTYINHKPLVMGNRHRLRFGDRISLGKGDLMTFIFKIIDE